MTVHFMMPGSLLRRTGGTIYGRRIIEGLRDQGQAVTTHELAGAFPLADATARAAAAAAAAQVPAGATLVIDGLVLPAFAGDAHRAIDGFHRVGLCHHPLALETGLDAATRERLRAAEAQLLQRMHRVVVSSPHTVPVLADYGVPAARISVVIPGVDPLPDGGARPRRRPGAPAALLSVANLIPRKGHAVLLRALVQLLDLDWRLTLAGAFDHDPATADAVRAQAAAPGLDGRVAIVGPLADAALDAAYRAADVFVLPSWYEGYGMVLAEAMQRGLPIVATRAGAIPETVPEAAGLLVPAGDAAALAAALRRLLTQPALYRRCAEGALAAAAALPDWPGAAARFAQAIAQR